MKDLQHILHTVTGSVDLPQTGIKLSLKHTGHSQTSSTDFPSYQEFQRELHADCKFELRAPVFS